MRFIAFIAAFFICLTVTPQGATQNEPKFRHHEIQLSLGAWGSVIHSNLSLENSGASGGEVSLEYRYYRKSPFGLGVALETAKLNTRNINDTMIKTAAGQFARTGLSFRYHIISKPKFIFFLGTYHQLSIFEYKATRKSDVHTELYCQGFQHVLSVGLNWYFSKSIGLFSDLRWHMQALRGNKYYIDGKEQELVDYIPVNNVFLNLRGLDFRLGISIRL